jgi:hypothetical protein
MAIHRPPLLSRVTQHNRNVLLRAERQELRSLQSTYRQARLELIDRLAHVRADTFTAQVARAAMLQAQDALRVFEEAFGSHIRSATNAAAELGRTQLAREIAFYEPEFKQAAGLVNTKMARNLADNRNLLLTRHETSVQTYGLETISRIGRRLAVAQVTRENVGKVIRDITGTDGIFQAQEFRALRILRTEVHHAANLNRQDYIEGAEEFIPGLKKQWIAVFDARTGEDSMQLHGQVVGVRESFILDGEPIPYPPERPNSRCGIVPYHEEWARGETAYDGPAAMGGPSQGGEVLAWAA